MRLSWLSMSKRFPTPVLYHSIYYLLPASKYLQRTLGLGPLMKLKLVVIIWEITYNIDETNKAKMQNNMVQKLQIKHSQEAN